MTTRTDTKPDTTARKPGPSRLSSWVPDPRWSHPIAAALWAYVAGVVLSLDAFGIPAWVMAPAGLVLAAIGVGRARRLWPEAEFGEEVRSSMSVLAGIAGISAGAWLTLALATSPLSAVGWLVLGAVWLGGWYAVLRTSAPKAAAAIVAVEEEAQVAAAASAWGDILEAAGLPLKVVETRQTRAGYVLGVEPLFDDKPVGIATLRSKLPDLTVKAAAMLARTGTVVRDGDIRVEETEAAHVHLIHVGTKHVLAETIPYVSPAEPATIADPIDIGLFEDGSPVELTFGGKHGGTNGKIVGATGSGKSVGANCIIGRVGECVDAMVFVLASDKLVPLVYPWIRPWLDGRAPRPAIDYVAGMNPQRVLEGMAMVYRLVRERNAGLANQPTHVPTPTAPAIVVVIEEAGDVASRKDTIVTHDGQRATFSLLLHLICKADRSAQVSFLIMNQGDLYGSLGDYGPDIARNTPLRICLKTLSSSDGPSVLPALTGTGTDTTKLRHHSMLIQPSIDEPRVMPAKSYHLDGDAIHDVAIRNAAWRPDIEPHLAAAFADVWTNRWDIARHPELAAACAADGLTWPVGQPEDAVDREFRELLARESAAAQPEQPAGRPEPTGDGEFPDADAAAAELTAVADRIGDKVVLPEPLGAVIALLSEPQAPRDFIPTRQLAILLGRVPADAEEEDLVAATRALGREMSAISEELRTEQRDRARGYSVPLLRQVAAKIARGGK